MSIGWTLAIAWIVMSLFMALLWGVFRRTQDAGIVDVGWGLGVATCGIGFAIASGAGLPLRRWIVSTLVAAWALRLSMYVFQRLLALPEDGRYKQLKADWGPDAARRMFWFFQVQALASVVFAVPIWLAAANPRPLGWSDVIGVGIWVVSFVGESIADRQLAAFRLNPGNRGRVCRAGFWRYSRHPNYFFEWLHWWSYVALAWGSRHGWLTLLGPALMYYLIRHVTGVPPTEAQALRSRGEAYREYQRTTSPFFPWPPKTSSPTLNTPHA